MKRNLKAARKQSGFTLLETLVVLAIAGLALAALAWGINKAFMSNDIENEATSLTKIMSALPDLKGSAGYGADGTNLVPQLITQNEIPSDLTISGGALTNEWDGAVTVVSHVTYVDISSANLPEEACNKLAVRLSHGANFKQTTINGGAAIVGEVTSDVASTQCTSAPNTITWSTAH